MSFVTLSKSLLLLSICLPQLCAAAAVTTAPSAQATNDNSPKIAPIVPIILAGSEAHAAQLASRSAQQKAADAAEFESRARVGNAPTVTINFPPATIIGLAPSSTAPNSEEFPNIPFAHPPVGQLRLKPPTPLTEPQGTILAQANGNACPQFIFTTDNILSPATAEIGLLLNTPLFQKALSQSEDCLSLNVHRPKGVKKGDKLPVLFWIFGGGFELGWNYMYDGSLWVEQSLNSSIGEPIIVVTVNYRVGGVGFLPGKEILKDGSANLGLLDQRLGMQWVADNIAEFGGDPSKVTIWGESAGAISVMDHMFAYNGDHTYKGKPLFRGAMMNSGSIIPADPVDSPKGQAIYDKVVQKAGCAWNEDTLACLRTLPYEDFVNALANVPALLGYDSVALSYIPRPDGTFLTASPDVLGLDGRFARVPFILGDQEDEGTIFGLFQSNITTKPEVVTYLNTRFFNHASTSLLETFVNLYDDISEYGSPFRTGTDWNWYPQFKRLAAILGDLTFTITRRGLLVIVQGVAPEIPYWSYLSSYDYNTPILGTFHGSDLLQVFWGIKDNYASGAFHEYYINFVTNLDPNKAGSPVGRKYRNSTLPFWPQWKKDNKLLNMYADHSQFIDDNFREPVLDLLLSNLTSFYF